MNDLLISEREGRLLRLTLNRPDKRNALNSDLSRILAEAIDRAARDRTIGAVLVAANGPAFCAGMDIQEIADGVSSRQLDALHEQIFAFNARIEKPFIAAVQGAALGGGMGLVANCHAVVAAPNATFGLTEIRLGLWPFLVFRAVCAALGERRTTELALTGRTVAAPDALHMGLISEIADDPQARALELARALADASPTAIQNGLSYVHQVHAMTWDKAGDVARLVREDVFGTDDFAEGIRAFLEKRPPKWPSIAEIEASAPRQDPAHAPGIPQAPEKA